MAPDGWLRREELEGVLAGHGKHVGDGHALEADLQRLAVVASALAHFAGHIHIGQEVHLDLDGPVARAGLAAPALDVEAEPAGQVAPHLRLVRGCVELANVVEDAGVGGGIRSRRAADRRLVDVDDLVERLGAFDRRVEAGHPLGGVDPLHQCLVENLIHQRALARARHACHADEAAQRELNVNLAQVVLPRPPDDQPVVAAGPAQRRDRDLPDAGEVLPRHRARRARQPVGGPAVDDLAAVLAGAGADVDHPVCDRDRLEIVLHDQHGVAEVTQVQQRVDQAAVVTLMQPDGRLVEHVQHAFEPAADLARQPDALGLAACQRRRRTVQRQVIQADVEQEVQPCVDLLDDRGRDDALSLSELKSIDDLRCLADRRRAELEDVPAGDPHGERHLVEPRAVTGSARHLAHVSLDAVA